MSQERVLTLLYDKTFPPKSQSTGALGVQLQGLRMPHSGSAATHIGLKSTESMHQFNYYGQINNASQAGTTAAYFNGIAPEDDLELLEKEIEQVMRCSTAQRGKRLDDNIVNMATNINRNRGRTAGTAQGGGPIGSRQRRRIPKSGSVGGPMSMGSFKMPMSHNKFILDSNAGVI